MWTRKDSGVSLRKEYSAMVCQWDVVCFGPLSRSEKTEACLAILRGFIDRLAILSARAPSPTFRFYATWWR
jgi:hypothetical protein